MSKLNRLWHEANPMPKNPTPEQRMVWHTGHATNCACRAMPAGVIALFKERGLPVPDQLAPDNSAGKKGNSFHKDDLDKA